MELTKVWVLRGRNHWAPVPVLEIELATASATRDGGEPAEPFAVGLAAVIAQLAPADALEPQRAAAVSLAAALEKLTLRLQQAVGSDVSFSVSKAVGPGRWRVAVEYEEEALGRACLEVAREWCLALRADKEVDVAERVSALRDLAHDVRLGPSTGAIVAAARARGIPVRRLNEGSLVQLGQGARARRILTAETDRTGAIAEAIAQDKQLTRGLLRAVGVPVPSGRPVSDADDACRAADELAVPVVIKPQHGNHGRGVTTNLLRPDDVRRAYAAAREEGSSVLVETFITGSDYRLLVVGDRLVAAALREPAHVIGDGRSTVRELVEIVNQDPRRSDGHSTVLSFIRIDPVAEAVLSEQGYSPESVPAAGERVLVRRNGNLSTGGTATDVTDDVHPEVAARAVEAARVIGLDIAGVDVVTRDISRPLEEQGGAVVEVNAGPGLRMHLQPSAGRPRPVGEAVVDLLFPPGENGRIPIVAVTGVNGKTTTTRLIAHVLACGGRFVGMACTDGLYVAGRRIDSRDCSGPVSARSLLLNPRVEAAVLETARGGILREGLGFDLCDVAVVTNIGDGDHLGLRGVETPDELAQVKRVVVEAVGPEGSAVLNAADPLVAGMAVHCAGSVVFFVEAANHPVLAAHRKAGGRAAYVRDGCVCLANGAEEEVLAPLTEVPLTLRGAVAFQVENVLAASAALWSLGVPLQAIRSGLASFVGGDMQLPGRFNVHRANDATVIVDYAHNPPALAALIEAVKVVGPRRRSVVFSPGNRRDDEVRAMGRQLGDAFDRVLLYTDRGHSDRGDGELTALLRSGLAVGNRVKEVTQAPDEQTAIANAFQNLAPGDLLVIGAEAVDDVIRSVREQIARLRPR